jgi:hypothetical protein
VTQTAVFVSVSGLNTNWSHLHRISAVSENSYLEEKGLTEWNFAAGQSEEDKGTKKRIRKAEISRNIDWYSIKPPQDGV